MYDIKFKLDQDIYYIHQTPRPEKTCACNICHGKKYVKINEETFKCPKCDGLGRIVTKHVQKWVPSKKPHKILNIRIEHDDRNPNKDPLNPKILYIISPSYYSIPQERIFGKFEEACQRCKELNEE